MGGCVGVANTTEGPVTAQVLSDACFFSRDYTDTHQQLGDRAAEAVWENDTELLRCLHCGHGGSNHVVQPSTNEYLWETPRYRCRCGHCRGFLIADTREQQQEQSFEM